MAFRTYWMVKGRFFSCLLRAWWKTLGRRLILFLVFHVQCVLVRGLFLEEAVSGGLEHDGQVAGEGAGHRLTW